MKSVSEATRLATRLCTAALFIALYSTASADLASGFDAGMSAAERAEEDKARDMARKPREVLEFVGIGAGMTVLDISASTGWYTEVHSAAVGPEGRVIAHNPAGRRERTEGAISAKAERLGNITVLFADFGSMELDAEVDAAFTALNLHDLQNRGAAAGQLFWETHTRLSNRAACSGSSTMKAAPGKTIRRCIASS